MSEKQIRLKSKFKDSMMMAFESFFGNFFLFLKVYSVFLLPVFFVQVFYLNNLLFFDWLLEQSDLVFFIFDWMVNLILLALFIFSVVSSYVVLSELKKGQKNISVIKIYKSAYQKFFGYLNCWVLYLCRVLLSFLKFIFPGLFTLIDYSAAGLLYLDEDDLSPLQALEKSKKIVAPVRNIYADQQLYCFLLLVSFSVCLFFFFDNVGDYFFLSDKFTLSKIAGYCQFLSIFLPFMFFIIFKYSLFQQLQKIPVNKKAEE